MKLSRLIEELQLNLSRFGDMDVLAVQAWPLTEDRKDPTVWKECGVSISNRPDSKPGFPVRVVRIAGL